MALLEKQIYGECVTILQGTLVEGSIEITDKSILRVNGQVEPPGYEAPRDDFEIKAQPFSVTAFALMDEERIRSVLSRWGSAEASITTESGTRVITAMSG